MTERMRSRLPGLIARIAVRLIVLLALIYAVHLLIGWFEAQVADKSPGAQMAMAVSVLAAYAILIAIPFVPVAELAFAALMMRGADIAPAIYLATLAGLMLAYWVGRVLPLGWLERACADLGLGRVAARLTAFVALSREQRLAALRQQLPRVLAPVLTDYRYLLLAVLINVPGNTIIGGGGGIMLVSGLSRLFSPFGVLLTLALAIAPIPFAFWYFGVDAMSWLSPAF